MVWPFRRKSNRKSLQSGPQLVPESENTMRKTGSTQNGQGRHNDGESVPERRRSRRDQKRKSSRESKKLQRDPRRAYSFSPGRNDSIRVARESSQDRPPVPPIPIDIKGKEKRAQTDHFTSSQVGGRPLRASTQPPEVSQWERMPTLHKRSAQDMARRKSSKKRKEEHDREAEIKSMAAFMPQRPAAEPNSSGRSLKRDSKRMRSGLSSQHKSSDISLPLAESIHSSLSGSETQTGFKLSGFDMLAPRPTIRYSEAPRYGPGPRGFGPDRSDSKKRRTSERIPEETLKANRRIDDLADDLDAGELRELMERDQKRKEKKKIAERIVAERRVARRQEKQRVDEATAARDGTPPPDNMERGVLGREVVGLGIGTSATITSTERRDSTGSNNAKEKRPTVDLRQDSVASSNNNPFATFQRSASLATENMTPTSEHSDPVIQIAKVGTVAKASVSPPASPRGHTRGVSSISQMMDLSRMEAEKSAQPALPQKPQPVRDASESSIKPQQSSWTSFFKRGSKIKRGSTPSSFSNTSRDSMHSAQAPQIGYTPMRSTSNVPKRTMSKFREDLPELPMSPPDSRMQSPEHYAPPVRTDNWDKREGRVSNDDPRVRYDTPTSGYRSIDALRTMEETPTSGHRSVDSPEPAAILSQSLASIDSEGSWLSGRRGSKRASAQPLYPLRDSANSLQKRFKEYSESAEELGIAEDEYFSRLSPEPEVENQIRRPSGAPMPSSDEEDGSITSPTPSAMEQGSTTWGAVPGRHPTVVHRSPAAKSREGLLNEYEDDSENDSSLRDSTNMDHTNRFKRRSGYNKSVVEDGELGVTLSRATSVDLGRGHARHISAGSARLLDVKPRASTEGKRMEERI